MKTKLRIPKRILSFMLALVMVLGMLPMTTYAAVNAPHYDDLSYITYSEGVSQYFTYENYLYKVTYTNYRYDNGEEIFLSDAYNRLKVDNPDGTIFLYKKNGYDTLRLEEFPKSENGILYGYAIENSKYVVNRDLPIVIITCLAVGDPVWTWNGTSSATATFTSTDGNAQMTVNATVTSSTTTVESCLEKNQITYTATATANGKQYTTTKTVDGDAGPHSYIYSSSGNTVTESCANCRNHTATATLTAADATYTGSAISTGASVSYSDGWAGSQEHGEITYSNNLNAGTATAKVTVEGKELTTTFEINETDISGVAVTLDPTSGTYTGTAYDPSVSVILDGFGTLVEGTDYTLSWNKTGFTNADTYTGTVTGKGNFEGTKNLIFTIDAANLTDVKVEQVGTLKYTGEALTPTVSTNAVAVNNQPITFTYSTESEGPYSAEIPSFTNAGWAHTVFYRATAANHNTYYGTFLVEVEKATVTEPTIASKPYTGSLQTADIADTDLYTVVKNEGGTGVKENGYYDVVLELKDSANYKWSTTDNAQVTLQFKITRAENEWTVNPSISGWTYGETANEPVGEAKFGEVSVEYSGTANDGTTYKNTTVPTKAGNYKATFIVQETEDYKGLETSVDFTIAKATYNMTGAKWKYTEPFRYNGKEHKVEVVGLPAGVTVESYENNTATAVGDYYAEVNLTYDANNYNAPTISKLGWTIYNDWTPTEYTVSTLNGNGWMNSDFVITANDGYKVSLTNTADGDWKDSLTYSGETTDGSVTFYLKNETDGTISLDKTVTYKLDKTAPNAEITVSTNKWNSFLNTITFGLFFKETQDVTVSASDSGSGVGSVQYYLADGTLSETELNAIDDWTAYNGTFKINPNNKYVIYAKVTDKAENVIYVNSDGMVLYTDSTLDTSVKDTITYVLTKNAEQAFTLNLNGNTVDYVKIGTTVLGSDDYEVLGNMVFISDEVLENLTVGEYTVTVGINPMGETFVDGDAPSEVTIPLLVEKAVVEIDISDFGKVYDGTPVSAEYEISKSSDSSPAVSNIPYNEKVEYKVYGEEDSTYTEEAPVNAGKYTVRISVAETDKTTSAAEIADFTVDKKKVSVTATAPDKVYDGTVNIDTSAIEFTASGLINDEMVGFAVKEAWYNGPSVGENKQVPVVFNVTGDAAENYEFPTGGEYMAPDYFIEATAAITAKDISDAFIILGDALTYNGAEQTQAVEKVVTPDDLEATYDVSGNTAKNVGIYMLTVKGNGNFTGEAMISYEIAPDTSGIESLTEDNVTSADKDDIEAVKSQIENAVTDLADDETKEKYKEIADKCDELLDKLEKVAEATDTENTEKVKDVTAENVTPEDKKDLEKAKDDLEKALKDNGGNYTEDEKKAIEDELKRIEDALEVIGNVEEVEELIDKLPENITKNDEDAIKAADDAYNALSDYEKSLVDEDAKKALANAKVALAELNKPADSNSPATGDTSSLWLWIVLLFVSGAGIFGITLFDRKKCQIKDK